MVGIIEYFASCCISTLSSAGIVLSTILYGLDQVRFEEASMLITLMIVIIIIHQLILKPLVEDKECNDTYETFN